MKILWVNQSFNSLKEFELVYVPTTMMQADVMTKNLPRPKFEKDIYAIGLVEDRQGKVLKKSRI